MSVLDTGLIIGSVADIVAMSKIEGLTFSRYIRYLTHLLATYTLGYADI